MKPCFNFYRGSSRCTLYVLNELLLIYWEHSRNMYNFISLYKCKMSCLFLDFSINIFILCLIINKYMEDKQELGESYNNNVESGWLVSIVVTPIVKIKVFSRNENLQFCLFQFWTYNKTESHHSLINNIFLYVELGLSPQSLTVPCGSPYWLPSTARTLLWWGLRYAMLYGYSKRVFRSLLYFIFEF